MSDDFDTDDQLGMAEVYELDAFTDDHADAYVLLDGWDVRLAICPSCGKGYCKCCTVHRTFPCVCDVDPLSQREMRDTYLRSFGGPTRRRHA